MRGMMAKAFLRGERPLHEYMVTDLEKAARKLAAAVSAVLNQATYAPGGGRAINPELFARMHNKLESLRGWLDLMEHDRQDAHKQKFGKKVLK